MTRTKSTEPYYTSFTLMASLGHTAQQDSHPVQYTGIDTVTPFLVSSRTILGHIRAQALQFVHFSSSTTGMYIVSRLLCGDSGFTENEPFIRA